LKRRQPQVYPLLPSVAEPSHATSIPCVPRRIIRGLSGTTGTTPSAVVRGDVRSGRTDSGPGHPGAAPRAARVATLCSTARC
jgi:hypothetical protein